MMAEIRGSLLIALALVGAGCKSETQPTVPAVFPETQEVAGWTKTGGTRTFSADRLWEYIDGDAERYVQAGVETTLTADYRYADRFDAVADIHIMQAPEGAKKIFESDSSEGSETIELGDAGRLWQGSLAFTEGRHYVRLAAYEQDDPEVGKALTELARAIENKLARQ